MTSELVIPTGVGESVLPSMVVPTVVVFPALFAQMEVSEAHAIAVVEKAVADNGPLALFWARGGEDVDAAAEVGVSARVARLVRMPSGEIRTLLQGVARVRRMSLVSREPALRVLVGEIEVPAAPVQGNPLHEAVLNSLRAVVQLSPTIPDEVAVMAANEKDAGRVADLVAASLELQPEERQTVLELIAPYERLELVLGYCERKRNQLELAQRIQQEVGERAGRGQREYLLREQLRAIQRELGELDPQEADVADLRSQLESLPLPEPVRAEVERELSRLDRINPASPEYAMVRTRLDWIAALPWGPPPEHPIDLREARDILDADHYDLEKIKDRILDYLAVTALRGGVHGPILCLVGPPGVGKTSLGESIARATHRPFIRASLGGVRDEAEIRGFRRTYVGAIPGRIIQGMRRANTRNPVFMLDEVDKLSVGLQGDPAAALLEVLDPAQNSTFTDTYLDVPYDLSAVFFICTANQLDTIPGPLLDRMEVIALSGYTEAEKRAIARRYLLPRQMREHALAEDAMVISDAVLSALISGWTREAGVRQLERRLAACCRKVARRHLEGHREPVEVTEELLREWLGPRRAEDPLLDEQISIGAATGLAWTPVGGDVLTVEAAIVRGTGRLSITGQLGDVMQESARAAITYARLRSDPLGLAADFFTTHDIHIHVPAGAIPKDGPSAGITLATALISAATRRPVRRRVAMTGEITLYGQVLPVGGIKEKVIAADRFGVDTVVLPQRNADDLEDVPADVRQRLRIELVRTMDEVLDVVLQAPPVSVGAE